MNLTEKDDIKAVHNKLKDIFEDYYSMSESPEKGVAIVISTYTDATEEQMKKAEEAFKEHTTFLDGGRTISYEIVTKVLV